MRRKHVLLVAMTALLMAGVAQANQVLNVHPDNAILVDGNPSDWDLNAGGGTKIHGGNDANPSTPDIKGDIAYQGWDGASLHYASYWTGGSLPANQADHTAQVYSRYDDTKLYFLGVVSDDDVKTPNGADMVWANDCIEFYIDPQNVARDWTLSNSASEIQLVIDAIGQMDVYMCTTGYTTQVKAGVTSAASSTANGYIIEASIVLTALDPDILNDLDSRFGLDLAFRDHDGSGGGAGDPLVSTMYSWSDTHSPANYPCKNPSHWGDGLIVPEPVTLAMLFLGGLFCLRRRRA